MKARAAMAAMAIWVTAGTATAQQQMIAVPIDLCADFELFADATAFPVDFTLATFRFHDASELAALTATAAMGETGLRFPPLGMGITLPAAVAEVTLRRGTSSEPVEIIGLDANFAVLGQTIVPGSNGFADVTLTGQGMRYVSIEGGGSQGILRSICIQATLVGGRPGEGGQQRMGTGGQGGFMQGPGAAP
jgi:hypothetical protein